MKSSKSSELDKILRKYFTGEQYDELHGTFIRIPFDKQMEKANQEIEAYVNKKIVEELESIQGFGERGGHDVYCRTMGEALLKRLKDLRIKERK